MFRPTTYRGRLPRSGFADAPAAAWTTGASGSVRLGTPLRPASGQTPGPVASAAMSASTSSRLPGLGRASCVRTNCESDMAEPLAPPFRPRRPGRPSGLEDARLARFYQALRSGLRRTPAARAAGISPNTLKAWLARARGTSARPATAEYENFLEAIEVCEAEIEYEVLMNMVADLPGHPRVAMRWLAMRWPERYQRPRRAALKHDREGAPEPRAAEPGPTIRVTEQATQAVPIPIDRLGEFADLFDPLEDTQSSRTDD
jgi:hypothetical protein